MAKPQLEYYTKNITFAKKITHKNLKYNKVRRIMPHRSLCKKERKK